MPVIPTYPGVYIEEISSGVRTIMGVSTSIALFIGRTKKGPTEKPVLCLNFTDFVRTFGVDTSLGELADSVRLFFENGGTQCYVMRITKDAKNAEVTLKSEVAGNPEVLKLTAKSVGLIGESIRAVVTYNGQQPEVTFNLELFRWEKVGDQQVRQDRELWPNLSMDPSSPRYAPTYLTQNSVLVKAEATGTVPAPSVGYSQSGRPIPFDSGTPSSFRSACAAIFGKNTEAVGNCFRISVDGTPYVNIDLSNIDVEGIPAGSVNNSKTALAGLIKNTINPVLPLGKAIDAIFIDGPTPPPGEGTGTTLLRISSDNGDVFIQSGVLNDLAVPLMLGTAQGGLEVSRYAMARPAPNGITFQAIDKIIAFAARPQNAFDKLLIDGNGNEISLATSLQTVSATSPMYKDNYSSSQTGHNYGVQEKLAILQAAINDFAARRSPFQWRAEVWGVRLALLPTGYGDNAIGTIITSNTTDIGTDFTKNIARYSLGTSGATTGLQTPAGEPASDGDPPSLTEYADAYKLVEKEINLFNLLILPKDDGVGAATPASLYGQASIFCQKRRAFLLIDTPSEWEKKTVQDVISPSTDPNVNSLRIGLVNDYSAIFYPRIVVNDNGIRKSIGAGGAIAGLMARTDSTRGVWKAPAGMDAGIRGIVGLEQLLSDDENGVLNQRGVNVLRLFPTGIVNWGARTMAGDDDFTSEYKYIPIRRLALYIEESLYRGTQWVVFEPNDEPLWAQIRLNLGTFMHGLFRQGAFQGASPREAYFVKCDSETTTQDDINRGRVNIVVGFAPLKPAEFVIIQLQQIAGQLQA